MGDKILFITIDSLRHDHYNYMGNTRNALGESHPHTYSTGTATPASFPSIFGGYYPDEIGVKPGESFVNKLEMKKKVGVTSNNFVSGEYGYAEGFTDFSSPKNDESIQSRLKSIVNNNLTVGSKPYQLVVSIYSFLQKVTAPISGSLPPTHRPAEDVINEFQENVDVQHDDEWFSWLHFMEPHHPYSPKNSEISERKARTLSRKAISGQLPSDKHETVRELYKQEIIELDQKLQQLWEDLPEDVTVVLTSDHGEYLGEFDLWGHPDGKLSPEVIHVPFATKNLGQDLSEVISLIDIGSYILGEEYNQGKLNREVAFATASNNKKAAVNTDHIVTPDGTYTHSFEEASDPRLEREWSSFSARGVSKSEGLEEDLEALGYK